VSVLADGNFVVTWIDGNRVFAQIYNSSLQSALTEDIIVYTANDQALLAPQVTAFHDGGFAVTFSTGNAQRDVYLATYDNEGVAVVAPTAIAEDVGDQPAPSVATLIDGRYLVSWTKTAGDLTQAVTQIVDPRTTGVNWDGSNDADQHGGTRFADDLDGGEGNDSLWGETVTIT
jgi:hypothetical protein